MFDTSSIEMLFLKAVAILKILSGTCSANHPATLSLPSVCSIWIGKIISFKPDKPVSKERNAF